MMQAMEAIFSHLALNQTSLQERKKLIRLSKEDVELLRALHIPLQEYENDLINSFYEHLMSFDFAQDLLADPELRARLQSTQKAYFRKLTAGVYDLDYAKDRIRVGIAHEGVGLTTQWYIGSYAVYLELTSHYIAQILALTPELIEPSINALYKVALLDITLAFDAYMYASHESIQAAKIGVSDKYDEQLRLQKSIDRIQKAFILNASYDSALELLLNELIDFTKSDFGLIGDVLYDANQAPYLKLRVLTNIAWNDETRALYASNQTNGLEFHNHNNLLGSVMTTGKPVISNMPAKDSRSGGVPEGHPTLNSYLGLPFSHNGKVVGMIGLANAGDGYNDEIVERLSPILDTLESLYEARKVRDRLTDTLIENDRLALVAKQTINGVIITDKLFQVQWCNDGFERMSGYSLDELAGKLPWEKLIGRETDKRDLAKLKNAVKACQPIELELLKYHKQGHTYWSRISCNPTYDEDGVHTGYVSVELDISDIRAQQDSLAKFKSVLDQTLDAVLFFDINTLNIIYANHGAQRYLDRSESELLSKTISELNGQYDEQGFLELIRPLCDKSQTSLNFTTWYAGRDGREIPSDVSMQLIPTADKQHIIVSVMRNLTTEVEYERLRQKNESQIATLLQRSGDAMGIISNEFIIIECNDAAAMLYGMSSRHDLIGLSALDLSPVSQPTGLSKDLAEFYINKALTEGYQRFEWFHTTPQDENTPIEVTLTPVIFHGQPSIQVVWRDLTDIKAKEYRIKQLAFFDELTGLANKNLFSDRVKHLIQLSERCDYTIAVLYLDIINLEDVNETLGYAAGDSLIYAVGKRISGIIRSADILAHYVFHDDPKNLEINHMEIDREFDSLARINGDIFALCAVVSSVDAAAILVNRLQNTLKAPFVISDSKIMVNSRVGVALYPQDAHTYDALARGATIALDIAKEKLLPYYFFNAQLGEEIQRRSLIAKRLEYSLKFMPENFSIRIQPQLNLQNLQLSGAEVLLRWEDSILGSISPGVFIPIAEERGLINELTKLVIKITSITLHSWKKQRDNLFTKLSIRLAINISAKSIDNPAFIEEFISDIKSSGLTPEYYELELTETGIMRDPETAIQIIKKLKMENFVLAIDDFGMGHSSLSYLRNIDADILKIDMFYIRNMLSDSKNMAIVKTIISTAQIFGMKTLAEGIEDKETAEELKQLGCDYGQGYYFSHPLTISEFEEKWIEATGHASGTERH